MSRDSASATSAPLLLLVDGTGVAYRAFFAVKHLSAPDGHPTNCLFGFVRLLDHLAKALHPDRMVVAFDGGSPASRLEKCPAYKAQRPHMPDDLRCQFPLLDDFLDAAGIPRCLIPHQEADDVLATLATDAAAHDWTVRIATSDKDLMQLVTPAIHLVSPSKDLAVLDPAAVQAKTGVAPSQIVEWLALIGDVADNIPGVPGIGPVTASRLLADHGTLEAVYAALPTLTPPGLRAKLVDARERTDINLALMTLDRHVPGVPAAATLPPPVPPSEDALVAFYRRHNLNSFVSERLFLSPPPPAPPAPTQLSLF
ncbi:MAG: hypothetical protein IJT88_10705 [Kiritimatiellae bacterium]|nr:hypothetical protein [Kiritimatiellia bacterium]